MLIYIYFLLCVYIYIKFQKSPAQSSQQDSDMIDRKIPTYIVIGDTKFLQCAKDFKKYGGNFRKCK